MDKLFGNVKEDKLSNSVNSLFSESIKSLSDDKVKSLKRTIAQVNDKKIEKDVKQQVEQQEQQEQQVEEKSNDETITKKQKKNKDADDLEEQYFNKLLNNDKTNDDEQKEQQSSSENESDENAEKETVKKHVEKAKKVDLKEDELEKADRTIFVGNLTNNVITSKNIYKDFKKLFQQLDDLKFVIESIRFRSISFDEALPRKVAFVQQKLHKSRDSINAYIVYKEKINIKKICSKLNGKIFGERHLRVDSVSHPAAHDKQRSVFVGNLDFEEDEESIWKHFNKCGDIEYVRIVRDSKTNLGKGFAYVQFQQLESVKKALLLNDKPMKSVHENKKARKLRISRCKNIKKTNESTTHGNKGNYNKLNEQQKTKFGRAQKSLGKADRATLGKNITIEGMRSTKDSSVSASKQLGRKKQRSKTGRVTKRSIAFKKKQQESKK